MSIFFLETTWYILPHHSKLEDPAKLWQKYDMWEILCCVEKNTREADGQSNGENRCSPYGHNENWNWNDIDLGLAMLFKCWAMPNKIRTYLSAPLSLLPHDMTWGDSEVFYLQGNHDPLRRCEKLVRCPKIPAKIHCRQRNTGSKIWCNTTYVKENCWIKIACAARPFAHVGTLRQCVRYMYCTCVQYSIAYQIPDRALSRFHIPIFQQSTSCVTSSSFGRQYSAVKIKPVKLQYSTAKYQPLQSPEIEIRKHGMDIIVCSPLFTPKHIVVTKISIQFLCSFGGIGGSIGRSLVECMITALRGRRRNVIILWRGGEGQTSITKPQV